MAIAAAGLVFSPVAAHATGTLSATGQAWAANSSTALANAEADAYGNLYEQARSLGETCVNVTYTTIGYYMPDGAPYGYWYEEQATGTCS